jgi:hypothetical protein
MAAGGLGSASAWDATRRRLPTARPTRDVKGGHPHTTRRRPSILFLPDLPDRDILSFGVSGILNMATSMIGGLEM